MCSWGQLDGEQSNLGDIVIFESMVATLRAIDPHVDIVAFSGDPAESSRRYGVRAYDVFHPSGAAAFMRELVTADLVLLGGGELVQDRSSKAYLVANLAPGLLAAASRRPFMAYAVGVSGPEETSPVGRRLAGRILGWAQAVTVRDEASAAHLARYGVDPAMIRVTADCAFQIDPASNGVWQGPVERAGLSPERPFALFAVRAFGHRRGGLLPAALRKRIGLSSGIGAIQSRSRLARDLAGIIDWTVTKLGLQVLLLPAQQKGRMALDDRDFCDEVASRCGVSSGVGTLRSRLPTGDLIAVMRHASFLLGTPLHSLILATMAHLPMVGLCYASKVERYLARIGMEDYALDLFRDPEATLPRNSVMNRIQALLARREDIARSLERRHGEMSLRAAENEVVLRRLLEAR